MDTSARNNTSDACTPLMSTANQGWVVGESRREVSSSAALSSQAYCNKSSGMVQVSIRHSHHEWWRDEERHWSLRIFFATRDSTLSLCQRTT
jgi:hypothetical protein